MMRRQKRPTGCHSCQYEKQQALANFMRNARREPGMVHREETGPSSRFQGPNCGVVEDEAI
jgi:hypothetical protein